MTADTAARFDLSDPLPRGKVAIQASAGTGKTYTLADLATRFIAEDRASASELLIVTFTRAATDELRARVRDRVVGAVEHLEPRSPRPSERRPAGPADRQRDGAQLARLTACRVRVRRRHRHHHSRIRQAGARCPRASPPEPTPTPDSMSTRPV